MDKIPRAALDFCEHVIKTYIIGGARHPLESEGRIDKTIEFSGGTGKGGLDMLVHEGGRLEIVGPPDRTAGIDPLDLLIAAARLEPLSYDEARRQAAGLLRSGSPLPPSLSSFVADVLEGRTKRPTRRGIQRQNYRRDYFLALSVHFLKKIYGIPPTRNEGSEPGRSGCDIVCIAAARVRYRANGKKLRSGTVAKIWTKFNHLSAK